MEINRRIEVVSSYCSVYSCREVNFDFHFYIGHAFVHMYNIDFWLSTILRQLDMHVSTSRFVLNNSTFFQFQKSCLSCHDICPMTGINRNIYIESISMPRTIHAFKIKEILGADQDEDLLQTLLKKLHWKFLIWNVATTQYRIP